MTVEEQLLLYQTADYPCSYLSNQIARSQMVVPLKSINQHNYGLLMDQGFRRSGLHVYRPNCSQCQKCMPMRVNVEQFEPNRSQKRTFKKWQNLNPSIHELDFETEHFELYQRYQQTRHNDGEMAQDGVEQYQDFLLRSQVNSFLVEFRDQQQQLMMVSLIDRVQHGLSAVYTFYEPNHSGLGTYGILWQISLARQINLPYVYLGFWIEGSEKMAYKANFAATEILTQGIWQPYSTKEIK